MRSESLVIVEDIYCRLEECENTADGNVMTADGPFALSDST